MSDQTVTPEPQENETPEVEAHSADVLGLQKLKDKLRFESAEAFSCSSCGAMSC